MPSFLAGPEITEQPRAGGSFLAKDDEEENWFQRFLAGLKQRVSEGAEWQRKLDPSGGQPLGEAIAQSLKPGFAQQAIAGVMSGSTLGRVKARVPEPKTLGEKAGRMVGEVVGMAPVAAASAGLGGGIAGAAAARAGLPTISQVAAHGAGAGAVMGAAKSVAQKDLANAPKNIIHEAATWAVFDVAAYGLSNAVRAIARKTGKPVDFVQKQVMASEKPPAEAAAELANKAGVPKEDLSQAGRAKLPLGQEKPLRSVEVDVTKPRDLGVLGKYLDSPSEIAKLDPTGNASKLVREAQFFVDSLNQNTRTDLAILKQAQELAGKGNESLVQKALDGEIPLENLPENVRNAVGMVRRLLDTKIQALSWAREIAKVKDPQKRALIMRAVRGEIDPATMPKDVQKTFNAIMKNAVQSIDNYFPHMVFGEYAILKDGQFVTAKESYNAAVEYANALKAQGAKQVLVTRRANIPAEVVTRLPRKTYFAMKRSIEESLGAGVTPEQLGAVMKSARVGLKPPIKFFGATQKRTGALEEYSRDTWRVLRSYVIGANKKIASDIFRPNAETYWEGIPAEIRSLKRYFGGATGDEGYIGAVQGRPGDLERLLDNTAEAIVKATGLDGLGVEVRPFWSRRVASKVSELTGIKALGWNLSSAIVNSTQTFINTYPVLGERHFLRATRDFATDAGQRLVEEMGVKLISPKTALGEWMPSIGESHGVLQPLFLFNKVEDVNRGIAALGGYNMAREAGKSHLQALEAGKRLADSIHFRMDVSDTPWLFQNPLGRVLGQFKAFTIKETKFAHNLLKKAAQEGDYGPFLRFLLAVETLGGLRAFPGVEQVDVLLRDRESGLTPLQKLERTGMAGTALSRGVLSAAGIDLSQRLGFGDVEFYAKRPQDLIQGPTVKTILDIAKAVKDWTKDKSSPSKQYALLRAVVPTQARYLAEAGRAALRGGDVVNPYYRDRLSYEATPYQIGLKATGLPVLQESQQREIGEGMSAVKEWYVDRKAELVDLIAEDLANDNAEAALGHVAEAVSEGIMIEPETVQSEFLKKRQPELLRIWSGLPKALKGRFLPNLGL